MGGGKSGKGGKGGATTNFDWPVKIIPVSPGLAGFLPDVLGAKVGDAVQAQVLDTVTWSNRTTVPHQPIRVDNGQPLCEEIPANKSSTPLYVVVGNVGDLIKYKCKLHPQETGGILIVPPFT